jgi:DNA polymerase III delta prime subunit
VRFFSACELRKGDVADLAEWLSPSSLPWPFEGQRAHKLAIIDEAQTMTPVAADALLGVLEGLPEWATIVLTTTDDVGESELFGMTSAFGSRCNQVHFEKPRTEKIAARLQEIAFAETGDGAAIDYKAIIKLGCCNVRKCIELLQREIEKVEKTDGNTAAE